MNTVKRCISGMFPFAVALACNYSSALSPPSFDTVIYFAKDSAKLEPDAAQALETLVCSLSTTKMHLMTLYAHAASDEKRPAALAERRALAVNAYMSKSGVLIKSAEVKNLSDSQPMSPKAEANQAVDIQFVRAEWPSSSASCMRGAASQPVAR